MKTEPVQYIKHSFCHYQNLTVAMTVHLANQRYALSFKLYVISQCSVVFDVYCT